MSGVCGLTKTKCLCLRSVPITLINKCVKSVEACPDVSNKGLNVISRV